MAAQMQFLAVLADYTLDSVSCSFPVHIQRIQPPVTATVQCLSRSIPGTMVPLIQMIFLATPWRIRSQTFLRPVFDMDSSGLAKCKVCETFTGVAHLMCPNHVSGHVKTKKHKHCLEALQIPVCGIPEIILAAPAIQQPELSISIDPMSPADNLCPESPHSICLQAEESPDDADSPLADLWHNLSSDRTYTFMDYFEEMQYRMEEGESLITCLLHPEDELRLEIDSDTSDVNDDENGLFDILASEIEGTSVSIVIQGPY